MEKIALSGGLLARNEKYTRANFGRLREEVELHQQF
jgi:hypothetical protein